MIENAVKYNHPGGAVTVTLGREGREVSVTVKDDGPGIPANALPHIFEPFYRADPSRSQQIPGSGLGLAVVQLIVERHGGEIQVQSRPGAGSAFKVLLKG